MGRPPPSMECHLPGEQNQPSKWSCAHVASRGNFQTSHIHRLQEKTKRMNETLAVLIPFGLGIVMSFAGSLPPGVISITVVDTAVRKSFRDGLLVAAAA